MALFAVFVLAAVSYAATSFRGQGTVDFDSIRIGQAGVGGVTYFNGSIINQTTTNGVDNPITFADNVRIDGRTWRGATQGPGDGSPFIIDDDAQVKGDLTVSGTLSAESIVGISSVVASAISKDGGLQGVQDDINAIEAKNKTQDTRLTNVENKNKTQDTSISGLNSDLNSTVSSLYDLTVDYLARRDNIAAIFNFLDCTANASQYTTYIESADYIDCWNTYMAGRTFPSELGSLSSSSALSPEGASVTLHGAMKDKTQAQKK